MKQENTQPLWKVLNEQRTQGEWEVDHEEKEQIILATPEITWAIASFYCEPVSDETRANAQYTALAVNNFAAVVESLENFIGCFDTPAMRLRGLNEFQFDTIETAKEALNRIS